MIFHPYWYFQSALTPDECNKIIELGLNSNMSSSLQHEKSADKNVSQWML